MLGINGMGEGAAVANGGIGTLGNEGGDIMEGEVIIGLMAGFEVATT